MRLKSLALILKIGYVKKVAAILFIIPGFVQTFWVNVIFKIFRSFSGDTFQIQQRNLFIKIEK